MQIDSIEIFRAPLEKSAILPPHERVESVLVKLASGDLAGWGEATLACAPVHCPEWPGSAFSCLRDWLAPAIVGKSISSARELAELLRPFQGNTYAKSAIDIAWWNLLAMQRGKPLYELLGGQRTTIPVFATVDIAASPAELLENVRRAYEIGYDHVVLKVRPGWDVHMLRAVRQAFPSEPLAIDCDGLCTLEQQESFYRIEDFFLKYIEQPLPADDLVGHAMLQSSLRTAVSLHQTASTLARVEQAIELESCRQFCIELGRAGGLTPALAMAEACRSAGIPCSTSATKQGPIAGFAAVALATLPSFPLATEIDLVEQPAWATEKLPVPGWDAERRLVLELPGAVGVGVEIDAQLLATHCMERAIVR